jgi:hypothetical protein
MLFRKYPSLLWDAEFLLRSLVGRSGLTWSHVLKMEEERLLREAVAQGRACRWRPPKVVALPARGDWRGGSV